MLTVAYDGTNYSGWQKQNNATTIEGELCRCLALAEGKEVELIGASRTDAGVHAYGNVAVFDTDSTLPYTAYIHILNHHLPKDITIRAAKEVPLDFHPRKCNTIKTYEYCIYNDEFPLPTNRLYTHFVNLPLDVEKMNEAATYLIGEHDFKSFCCVKTQAQSTVRTIYDIKVQKSDKLITIRVTGNGFLYNMVRIIAGTLIKVGSGHYTTDYVKEMLEKCDRTVAGPTAPPQGLRLVNIEYPDENLGENNEKNPLTCG